MANILILAFSTLHRDPRVLRDLGSLKSKHKLTTVGFGSSGVAGVSSINIPRGKRSLVRKALDALILVGRGFSLFYWRRQPEIHCLLAEVKGRDFDLIIAHDFQTLPVALRIAGEAPVILNAHEFAPGQLSRRSPTGIIFGPYNTWLTRTYLKRARAVITVSPRIARAYSEEFDVALPTVIRNIPKAVTLVPSPCSGDRIKLIYHGITGRNRGIDNIIRAALHFEEKFELHLILVGASEREMKRLRGLCGNLGNVFFHEPVATEEIAGFINQFDMGVVFWPPVTPNLHWALPNKFFEYIQARLGVIVGPYEEMAPIVRARNLGVVAESFHPLSLVAELRSLTKEQVEGFKSASDLAARDLCWEREEPRLLQVINEMQKGSKI